MKKIYNILLTAAALLAFAPVVSAQTDWSINGQIKDAGNNNANPVFPPETDNGLQVDKTKAVAYTKNISKPFSDGTYWIKLETFATGSASYTVSNAPADIVLVLDFSQSMTATYYTSGTHYVPVVSTQNNQNGNYTYQFLTQNTRYVEYDGEYYRIQIDRTETAFNQGGYAWAYFKVGDTTYYLDGNEISTTQPVWSGSGNFGNNTVMWRGALFQMYNNQNVSRVNALKEAVADFIDVIYHNDNYDENDELRASPLGNRISIVIYSANNANDSRQIADWTTVSTSSRAKNETLLRSIAAVTNTPMGTYSNRGMALANNLLSAIKSDTERWENASRTVVLFTDGAPGNYSSWRDPESTNVANACIAAAKTAKTDNDATVFTVALYTWPASYSGNEKLMRDYMNYVSSNYKNANDLTHPNYDEEDDPGYDGDYFKIAGDDLQGVFQTIAHHSGGSSNTSLSAATSTVDVVSSSFILPEGADASSIKVFTAKCTYADPDNDDYRFNTEIMIDHSGDEYNTYDKDGNVTGTFDVDDDIEVELGTDDDGNPKIEVIGFDYSNNWCGPVEDEHGNVTYQGHKVIVMIPVQMNPDAVGGPNVPTNAEGSGIYVSGDDPDPLIPFISPSVSLPVNIYIKKTGLNHGESAKFKIERAEIPASGSWTPEGLSYSYVSTVFVTQPETAIDEAPVIVKVKGLPANKSQTIGYIYKVTEEEWAWSYKRDKTPQYTVTSKVDNPFTFDNEKKDGVEMKLHHAESKVNNVFKSTAATKEYNDSKTNDR